MQDHKWIVDVCVDLESYAQKHRLAHLASALTDAVAVARTEEILRSSKFAGKHSSLSDTHCIDHSDAVRLRGRA